MKQEYFARGIKNLFFRDAIATLEGNSTLVNYIEILKKIRNIFFELIFSFNILLCEKNFTIPSSIFLLLTLTIFTVNL